MTRAKRKPFIAIEIEVFEMVEAMAIASGRSEAEVGWGLVKVWRWCWKRGVAVLPVAVVNGFFPPGAQLFVDFGFGEKSGDSVRIRGLDRYLKTAQAQRDAARQTNEKRWGVVPTGYESESLSESVSESVSDVAYVPSRVRERGEDTKIRRSEDPKIEDQKILQRGRSAKRSRPKQESLIPEPPKPPRPPTRLGTLIAKLEDQRLDQIKLNRLNAGVDDPDEIEKPSPDTHPDFARLGAWLAKVSSIVRKREPDADDARVDTLIALAHFEWVETATYWAGPKPDERTGVVTPYPLGAFISEKQFQPMLDKFLVDESEPGNA